MTHYQEYAVVDLGSNSFHLVITRQRKNSLQVLYKNKENIRLASYLTKEKEIRQEGITKGVNCLKLFAERLKTIPRENIKVVATHTLRVAKNRNQFLLAASEVFPYPIELISGQEEARLIYLGAINNESAKATENKLIIDIGGGSTEIALGKNNTPEIAESRPIGCVTFTEQFFPDGMISSMAFQAATLSAEQELEKLSSLLKERSFSIAYGSSGTIKSLYEILLDLGASDGIITKKRLFDIVSYLLECSHINEIPFPSVSEERKPLLLAGVAIFYAAFKTLGLKELHYSQSSLREGVLLQMIGAEHYQNVCQNTVSNLMLDYLIDNQFAQQLEKTVKHFYRQWKNSLSFKPNKDLQSLVIWAACLHEIGLCINFSNFHKHSAYIIQHLNLPGFNEEQQLLLATLVRFHRKAIKTDQFPEFNLFEQREFQAMLQILRLSILMNVERTTKIDIKSVELSLIKDHPNHFELKIDQSFADEHQLIMFDLKQERKLWANTDLWALKIRIDNPEPSEIEY